MNPILMEMMSVYSGDPFDFLFDEDEDLSYPLMHSYEAQGMSVQGPGGRTAEASSNGIGSGRFRKGEGEKPYQHGVDFLDRVELMKKEGLKGKDLAVAVGCKNTTDFRVQYTRALNDWKKTRASKARALIDSGMTKKAVAQKFGIRDSTLASWLNPKSLERISAAQQTADFLEAQVKEKHLIDVGEGVEKELNISKEKMREALVMLQDKGYVMYYGRVPQATNPGRKTSLSVLATPDESWSDLYNHPEKIQSVKDYICREDSNGEVRFEKKWQRPASLDSSRLMIRYRDDVAPDGHTGLEKDGTIEIRRNVEDLDLRGSHYAQVRIMVDGKKYLKGMAHYSDHMPDGIDVIFNTNKTREQADIVLKNIKKDPDNPFGALLREKGGQYTYIDKDGNVKLGLINKTRQEGDWEDWKDKLPSQFLAKQPMALIDKQLGEAISEKKAELAEIMAITNPTVKKSLLDDFASQCDSDAVHMSAAKLPRQKYQVILPVPTLKDNEVYAPNYYDGETVALIRFPHAGQFEIPILKVNNSNPQGKELMGERPMDAVGVNKANADLLSGADFDGDTVMVVPCNDTRYSDTKIQNRPPLPGLEGFDAKDVYGYDDIKTTIEKVKKKDGTYEEKEVTHYYKNGVEFKPMTRTGLEMGVVSNLIMDMTLKGAGPEDLAAAVRHSMTVIDAEKHHLDWKQSEIDNHIKELKKKYQERIDDEDGSVHYGASTLLTRAKSPAQIIKPTGSPHIDPETGKLVYSPSQLKPQIYKDKKTGKEKVRMEDVNLLDTYDDAFKLVSTYDPKNPDKPFITSPKEAAYARYSNMLRAMANEARKEILVAGDIKYNSQAEKEYHDEATHLLEEVRTAELNAPRERMAQLYARGVTLAKIEDNPDMTKKERKKASQQALADGRIKFGASRHKIDISPREWEAIQSGAISPSKLTSLLKYADPDVVRKYATPKSMVLTEGQIQRIRKMLSGAKAPTPIQIHEATGLPLTAIKRIEKEMEMNEE